MGIKDKRRVVPAPEYSEEEFKKNLEEIKKKLAQEVDEGENEEKNKKLQDLKSKIENDEIKLEDISIEDIKKLQDLYNKQIEDHVSDINKLIDILQKYKTKVGILKEKCKNKKEKQNKNK